MSDDLIERLETERDKIRTLNIVLSKLLGSAATRLKELEAAAKAPLPDEKWRTAVLAAEGLSDWTIKIAADAYCWRSVRVIQLPADASPSLFLHEVAHALHQEPEGTLKNHYHGGQWAAEFGRLVDRHLAERAAGRNSLPDEVAELISELREEASHRPDDRALGVECTMEWKAAAALEQQAREIWGLKRQTEEINNMRQDEEMLHARIAELEAELRSSHKEHAKTLSTLGDRTIRLGEIEAERDAVMKRLLDSPRFLQAERDAIEAATIERCIAAGNEVVKTWRQDAQDRVAKQPPRHDEANTANAHANGAEEVVEAIRAIAKPSEKI